MDAQVAGHGHVAEATQVCTTCVMDTTDPEIEFDASGRCHHCIRMAAQRGVTWFPDEGENSPRLQALLRPLRDYGVGRKYDCILGLSGGFDSSYLALKALDWGLRPLVVHVDTGWNSELAVQNVEQLVRYTGFELHTHVIPWQPMRDLQLSYLRAGVANQDVPQDHALFAALYRFATKSGIRYVLNGGNVATEGIFPSSWHWPAMDSRNLKDIHRKFGEDALRGYPTVGLLRYYVWYPYVRRMKPIRPLNYTPYSKSLASKELQNRASWRPYPNKHGESKFTRFFQDYYLPTKFGLDKRKPHLSSRVVSGELTRAEALAELRMPLYTLEELARDKSFIARKLRIADAEFQNLLDSPKHDAAEFANWQRGYNRLKSAQSMLRDVTGKPLTTYS